MLIRKIRSEAIRVMRRLQRSIARRNRKQAMKRLESSKDTTVTIGKFTLASFLPSNPVVLDLGAHDGSDSEELALLFPGGHVWAFEAQSDLYGKLRRRLENYPNATAIHAAVNDTNGVVTFHQSSGGSFGSGSILVPTGHLDSHPTVVFQSRDRELVPALSLKSFLSEAEVPKVDLIWMDLQGAELLALRGLGNFLANVSVIYTEVSSIPLYKGASTYAQLQSFLSGFGFKVQREFIPHGWTGEGNVLFTKT